MSLLSQIEKLKTPHVPVGIFFLALTAVDMRDGGARQTEGDDGDDRGEDSRTRFPNDASDLFHAWHDITSLIVACTECLLLGVCR